MRDQPALTTASGRSWLITGGLLAVIALAVLVPMIPLEPPGVALTSVALIVVLYAGMLAALALPLGKRRLGVMAWGMILIAVVALVGVGIVASEQWGIFG